MSAPSSLHESTRAELYEMAQEHDIAGRSSMSKDDLVEALEQAGEGDEGVGGGRQTASKYDAFDRLATANAAGEIVWLPRHLQGNDRRLHVRQTLREDHETRIAQQSEDPREKFDKLAGSLFSFFRGTCLLFYRDLAGEDSWMPTVLTLGDVHPENFGVMPSADNVPIFGVNDFDEAYYAPFTWDLKRGAVGFLIAAEEEGDQSEKRQRKIVRHFVKGYVDGIESFARDGLEMEHQVRLDNAPDLVADLIESANGARPSWLASEYHDEYGRGFRADDELVPISSRRDEFQDLIDRWVQECDIAVPPRAGEMRVKDVAIRRGEGTASLGLSRYYVLIEGERQDASDDIIIEFKRARRSALAGLVPPSAFGGGELGDRIARAQGVQLVRADVFYGSVEFEGQSFMSRERAPYRDDIDLDDLSKNEWRRYARICGRALAQAHALSDETGEIDHDIEPMIVEVTTPGKLFVDDIVRFAFDAAERLRRDHEYFKADHELGAFDTIDVIYR